MKTRLTVSSAGRDTTRYPAPNKYDACFPFVFKNVRSVALLAATLPLVDTVISSNRSTFNVTVNSSPQTVTLPFGTPADAPALAAIVQGALQAALPAAGFTAASPSMSLITISCGTPFSLSPMDPGVFAILGLVNNAPVASAFDGTTGLYSVKAPFPVDLRPDKAIILRIDNMEATTSNDQVIDRTFAVLPTSHLHKCLPVCYRPPTDYIGKLELMKISFLRMDGTPYNFLNQENYLQFEFEHGAT